MMKRGIASLTLIFFFSTTLFSQSHKASTAAHPAPVAPNAELSEKIAAIVAAPEVSHASFGISVATLDGRPLYGLNEGKLMTPASNVKMTTTAAAFALLPGAMTWNTLVVATGPVEQGVLKGNLVILGAGDPTLSIRHYPYQSAAERAAANAAVANSPDANGETPSKPKPLDPLEELAAQVQQAGIREVTGSVIGDDSFFFMNRMDQVGVGMI